MAYWLMKSEPDVYSYDNLVKDKRTSWSGIRNHLANKHMKMMAIGDEAFFYHSNIGKEIVGIMKVVKLWHLDPEDETGTFGMVDVAPVRALTNPVTLAELKADKALKDMQLLKQGRLSVTSVTDKEWAHILKKNAF